MKKNGFTLIELVVVIVILGILAVVAAPKFMNLQNDARNASLKGLEGAFKSALNISYAKLATMGLEDSPYVSTADRRKNPDGSWLDTPGIYSVKLPFPECTKKHPCTFAYGYPQFDDNTLQQLVTLHGDWTLVRTTDSEGNYVIKITFPEFTKKVTENNYKKPIMTRNNCYLTYYMATKDRPYKLTLTKCK
ncbi:prepilin-type N-terminal cleavage/methylation domain-containing protein [Photobacterium iliopiscarium]|uniref:prepilin-type N-terminal cleavage/methylation domain-containing protein n=1 Tax=Photobacterium iliopiscarium TaxID=56192 RepID=UPI001E5E8551|nr:prepilin-type N-terminal cleavage/methylation domain-containing protein [Photobacterium iliopiscarium]MCD9468308.1 hypothetical protein [Photobacterium iliopiscarium]MCD9488292.1 prepilin-type N-terminal cleavage/methylation domain-containing protein [Photobacterium iliopiscarium]MCF2245061.1 prepilin-type N-terminal cleavage/methylation domain-containing protein [Photobacterium iliopiscarium]